MNEGEIQNSICEYLEYRRGIMFWRQNSSGSFYKAEDGSRQFRRPPKYAKNGVPDIIVVKAGKFIGLEVKKKGGKQSDAQVKFQEELEAVQGEYYVVESIDDVIKLGI